MADSTLDIRQQQETWRRFVKFVQLNVIAIVVLLILMAYFLL